MIECWSESVGTAAGNMDEDILVELVGLIRCHPWWRARAQLTLGLLARLNVRPPARVIDAGCGWGVTLRALEDRGYEAIGLDISRRMLDRLMAERPGRRLVLADLESPLASRAEAADAVLALDVIEHLDDDREALRRLACLARPGAPVVVSVPALPEMYTEFDAIQGHRRRYLPQTLRDAFEGSGLRLERLFWWGRWLLPALRRMRTRPRGRIGESPAQVYRRHLALPPWPLPLVARLAFLVEQPMALRGRLHAGTSLFAVARRPTEQAG
jgi:SAM-dependent methyltransferase